MSRAQVLLLAPGCGPVTYFAHSKLDYGTAAAARAKAVVRAARPGRRILDPSRFGQVWPDLAERLGSQDAVYKLVVSCCAEVVAFEHEQHVGRGVYTELAEAEQQGRPRFVVRNEQLVPVRRIEVVDPSDFKRRFGRVLAKEPSHDVAA